MNRRFWTSTEITFLEQNISFMSVGQCAQALNRTRMSVYNKVNRLGLEPQNLRLWTKEDETFLKNNYHKLSSKEIGKKVNRTAKQVQGKASKMGIAQKNFFPPERFCKICSKKLGNKYMKPVYCSDCFPGHCGEDNSNWKGGVKTLYSMAQSLLRPWRVKILNRDNHQCQTCGEIENLNVHHLRLFKDIRDLVIERNPDLTVENYKDRKTLARLIADEHQLNDGTTLCRNCHLKIHSETQGELLETPNTSGEDNQQPSLSNVINLVDKKVQRLMGEEIITDNPDTSALHTALLV